MLTIVGSFITPAIVASLITLLVNLRIAKQKEFREAISKRLDEARGLVAASVDAAAAYYCLDAIDRTAQSEAKLWMAEREVRLGLASLTTTSHPELEVQFTKLQHDFDFFVSELTGGNFQQKSAVADLTHIRRIAGLGAELRQSILSLNEAEIRRRLEKDWITRTMRSLQIKPYYKSLSD